MFAHSKYGTTIKVKFLFTKIMDCATGTIERIKNPLTIKNIFQYLYWLITTTDNEEVKKKKVRSHVKKITKYLRFDNNQSREHHVSDNCVKCLPIFLSRTIFMT